MIIGFLISFAALQANAASFRCQSDKEIMTEGEESVKEVVIYRIESLDSSVVASNLSSTADVFPDDGTGTIAVSFSNQCDNMYGVVFKTTEVEHLTSGRKSEITGEVSFDWIGKIGGEEKANLTCQLISDSEAAKALGINQ